MSVFQPLDQALLWLRLRSRRKQREVADAAGITQAMLSSYEKGHRIPSLLSLERILGALNAGLPELYDALEVVKQAQLYRSSTGAGVPREPPRARGHTPPQADPVAGLQLPRQDAAPVRQESLEGVLDELRRALARVSAELTALGREKS